MGDGKLNVVKDTGAIGSAQAIELAELVAYAEGSVVSRTLTKGKSGTMTVFAFDAGQSLSEHSTPFDAYVLVLDGEGQLIIGGSPVTAKAGQVVLMPANVPHAVQAIGRFKMLLLMFRGQA